MSAKSLIRRVEQRRLSDEVRQILRDLILRQELPAGQRLDLDELKDRLGVSRTPVREALDRLAREGLVTILPRRGTYVTKWTSREVAERFDVRLFLEMGMVDALLANVGKDHLSLLRRLHADMAAYLTKANLAEGFFEFVDLDSRFHSAMVQATGNLLLADIYERLNLSPYMAKVFYLAENKRLEVVHQEHGQILRALEARDAKALRQAIGNHIRNSKRAVAPGFESQSPADGV